MSETRKFCHNKTKSQALLKLGLNPTSNSSYSKRKTGVFIE